MNKDFIFKKLTPSPIRKLRKIIRDHHALLSFSELSMVEKFNKIYQEKQVVWISKRWKIGL
tara:strand:+ start:59 stop:241 length:183 start_codon:yes stop_codon:yes gene_type:complete